MYQPVIPAAGVAGWRFLQRTYDSQFEAFTKSVQLQRDTEYFAEKIGGVSSAEELVSDRRLLTVALGAFGLEEDINNKFFIRKMLEEGTTADDALANRFTDPRYANLSEAFGFGPGETPQNTQAGFAAEIINKFERASFEVAAGEQDQTMRIALYASHRLAELVEDSSSNNSKWFTLMGDPPMRELMEKALNLPTEFGQIDIDQQLEVFKDRAMRQFGTDDLTTLANDETLAKITDRFLVRSQIDSFSGGLSSGGIALALLGA